MNRNWIGEKIGNIGKVVTGKTPPTKIPEYFGTEYPFITPSDMDGRKVIDKTDRYLSIKGAELMKNLLIPQNSICVSCIGWQMGKVVMTNRTSFTNQQINSIIPNEKVDANFIFYAISIRRKELLSLGSSTGVRTPILNKTAFSELNIMLPPLPTQRKIAAILSAYDELIENNTRRIQILEEMAQRIYREWFMHFRFPGHEGVKMVDSELGMIPEGWEVKFIEDLYGTTSGGTPSRKVPEYYGGSIQWVKTRELNDRYIIDTEEKITMKGLSRSSAKMIPENSVLMAMYGATIGKLGILEKPSTVNQACCAIIMKDVYFTYPYIFSYLLANRKEIISLGRGAAQQNVSQIVIRKFKILKPRNNILQLFNKAAYSIFESIKNLQKKNENLRQTRDLLLPKLISGKIDVADLDIAVGVQENEQL